MSRFLPSRGYIFLVIMLLALAGPVAAVAVLTIDNSSTNAISSNLTNVDVGGTLILNPGTYFENGLVISQDSTLRANTSYGGTAADTIIDGGKAGTRIMTVNPGVTMVIDNLTFQKGAVNMGKGGAINNAGILTITSTTFSDCGPPSGGPPKTDGGAIENTGILTITSPTFTGCSVPAGGGAIDNSGTLTVTSSIFISCSGYGGAIFSSGNATITSSTFSGCYNGGGRGGSVYVPSGTVSITSSTFISCTAPNGGAIYSSGDTTIMSTTFSGCTADNGGAIYVDGGTATIINSTITLCTATIYGGAINIAAGDLIVISSDLSNCIVGGAGAGSAIYNVAATSATVHFSRMVNDTGGDGSVTNSFTTSIDATDCWWGSNANPSAFAVGDIATPWLVLGITASPSSISPTQTPAVRTNLTFNSNGADISGGGIFVPNGIPVSFAISGGTGGILPLSGNITAGANTTRFTPAGVGTCTITATVDLQSVTVPVMVNSAGTSVTGISPAGGRIIGGEMVTITGSGFTGASAVTFGTTASPSYSVDSDTQIRAIAPPHTKGTIDITVTAPGGTSPVVAADRFTYTNVPVVTGVSPTSGPDSGTMVTITGMGFNGTTDVKFGTVSPGWFAIDNDMQITAYYQPGTAGTTIDITVITPEGTSATGPADRFTFISSSVNTGTETSDGDGPTILLPVIANDVNVGGNSAVGRTTVTGTGINGMIMTAIMQSSPATGIPPVQGIVYQYFELVPARYTSITGTTITFTVPVSWLEEHHLNPQDIVMYHYTGGAWTALPTTVGTDANGVISFTATSPSFSLFAIAGRPGAVPTTIAPLPAQPAGDREVQSTPRAATVTQTPVVQQTTAAPAPATSQPQPLPVTVIAISGLIILAAGGFIIRRWWIQRQNPALFREYD